MDKYPDKYQGFKLRWNDNKPHFKKGEVIIIKTDSGYESVTLKTMTKEPMQTKWIRRCWRCKKPGSIIDVDKFVYRWNDGRVTEHPNVVIDSVKELNVLRLALDDRDKQIKKLSKKASLYNQIKMSINGELFSYD